MGAPSPAGGSIVGLLLLAIGAAASSSEVGSVVVDGAVSNLRRRLSQLNEIVDLECTATRKRTEWTDELCTSRCEAARDVPAVLDGHSDAQCPGNECMCEVAPQGNPYKGVVQPAGKVCYSLRVRDDSKHMTVVINTTTHVPPPPPVPEEGEEGYGEIVEPPGPSGLVLMMRSGTGDRGKRRLPNKHEHEVRVQTGAEPGSTGFAKLARDRWRRRFGARDEGEWVGLWTMCVQPAPDARLPVGYDFRVVFSECPSEPDGRECGGRGECGEVKVPCKAPLEDQMCKADVCVCNPGWAGEDCSTSVPIPPMAQDPPPPPPSPAPPVPGTPPVPGSPPPPPPPVHVRSPPPPIHTIIMLPENDDPQVPIVMPTRGPTPAPTVALELPHHPEEPRPMLEFPGGRGGDSETDTSGMGKRVFTGGDGDATGSWAYPVIGLLVIFSMVLLAVRVKGVRWLMSLRGIAAAGYEPLPSGEPAGKGGGKGFFELEDSDDEAMYQEDAKLLGKGDGTAVVASPGPGPGALHSRGPNKV